MRADGSDACVVFSHHVRSHRIVFLSKVFLLYAGFVEMRSASERNNLGTLRCAASATESATRSHCTTHRYRCPSRYRVRADLRQHETQVGVSVRLPLSSFMTRRMTSRAGQPAAPWPPTTTPKLVLEVIWQFAAQYTKPTVAPEKDDARLCLCVDYLKAYRMDDKPDLDLFSYLSMSNGDWASYELRTGALRGGSGRWGHLEVCAREALAAVGTTIHHHIWRGDDVTVDVPALRDGVMLMGLTMANGTFTTNG